MQTFIALLSFKNEIKMQNEGSFAILIASLLLPFPGILFSISFHAEDLPKQTKTDRFLRMNFIRLDRNQYFDFLIFSIRQTIVFRSLAF